MGGRIWKIVNDGYVILKQDELTPTDEDNILVNDQAMNVLYDALDVSEFNRIKNLKTAHEIWTKLMEIHEGTTMVKSAKLYVYKGKFDKFAMNKEESVSEMFNRLNEIVNELKGLGFDVLDEDFSHKFLRSLPSRYDTIVTLHVRSDLKKTSPTEVLGEILTHEIFKKSQEEAHGEVVDDKKKCIAFKAQASKKVVKYDSEDESNASESDDEMAIFVRRFNKFLKKKKSFSERTDHQTRTHLKKKNNDDSDDEKKKKKYYDKKKKNGQAYLVEWDSDASLDSDDDGKPRKGVAGIAIKEAPSLFSTPHCLMARNDTIDDSDEDEDEEYTYDDLVRMLKEADEYMHKEKVKYKALKKQNKDLEESLRELKSSHKNLKEAHDKLKEVNTQLVHEVTKAKEKMIGTCSMDGSQDAPSSSTSLFSMSNEASTSNGPSTSVSTSDGISCDTTLIVENEILRKKVDELTCDLERAYGGKTCLDMILCTRKCSINN
ncbi:hypothetical protein BS78_07G141700 [Paspalum vaginatum]|nr:hypothetical protein BS78_07G141700 [Paspalum vaginatum]